MKLESLHGLILDHHLGELSPEVAELLEQYLAVNAVARAEAARFLEDVSTTRSAVLRYPELGRVPVSGHPAVEMPSGGRRRWGFGSKLGRAAAVLVLGGLLGGLLGGGGHLAWRAQVPVSERLEGAVVPRVGSPWAQYRMAFDAAGQGVRVVRVETEEMRMGGMR